jgi:PAS domain S-box-containing protein
LLVVELHGDLPARLELPPAALLPPAEAGGALALCLYDALAQPPRRLSGDTLCDADARRALRRDEPVSLAGHPLLLRVLARPSYAARDRAVATWAVDALALCGSLLVVAFVFVSTGRTMRVEQMVNERTRALGDSEARLRSVVHAAGLGMVDLDADARIVQLNDEAADLAGLGAEAARGRPFAGLFRPQDRMPIEAAIGAALAGDRPRAVAEVTIVRADASRTDLLLRLEAAGGAGRVVALLQDLTDLRRLQSAEVARSRAEQESRARGEFVSRMSHELRTPLNAILGFTQLVRGRPEEPLAARDEKLGMIERAGWHLLSMIEDILLLGRLENTADRAAAEPVDLNHVLRASVAMIAPEVELHGLSLHAPPDPRAPQALADETRVQQVLLNLLSNAVKYNRPGGQVRVRVIERPGQWGVQVEDDGVGLTPQQVQGLFIPFNRLGQERTQTKGTGIGLAISLRLAQQMHGAITVDSHPGQGSRFTLWLPQLRHVEAAEAIEAARSTLSGHLLAGHLLVVEDNEVNVEVMKGVFAGDEAIELRSAGTGVQALALLRRWPVDVVLLDLHLPDMDGLALLRTLLSGVQAVPPRVIVVSADNDEQTRDEAMAAGAFDVCPKPFEVSVLRGKVLHALQAEPV